MSRLIPIAPDHMTAEQEAIFDRLSAGPRQGVRGPFEAWMYSPRIAQHLDEMGSYLRFDTGLPARLVEMTVLQTVGFWRSRFAWNRHVKLARELKIEESVIECMRRGASPMHTNATECALYQFVHALLNKQPTSEMDWQRVVQAYGERGAVNLVGLVGYYSFVALTLAANDADHEEPNPFNGSSDWNEFFDRAF